MENTRATISRLAPAKLNLLLAITGARQDGFHDLVSLVAIVAGNDLADEISLTATFGDNARDTLVCDKPDLPCDDNNLVLRATKLFREQFPLRASLHWVVKKRIPSGAGLGGGSSDAATALRMLDEISRMPTTNPSSTTNPRSTTNPVATTNPAPEIFRPTLGDVFLYVRDLAECVAQPGDNPERVAARMKKFLNFVGTGVDARGEFLFEARRAKTPDEIFAVSEKFMLAGNRAEQPFPDEPFSGIVARPNCEI